MTRTTMLWSAGLCMACNAVDFEPAPSHATGTVVAAKADARAPSAVDRDDRDDRETLREASASRVAHIRDRHADIEAREHLLSTTFELACRDGELRARGELLADEDDGGEVVKSTLDVSMAGHASEAYTLYYEGGEPMFALHARNTWRFAGGAAERPGTRDLVTERRYYFDGERALRCLYKRAEAASGAIEEALSEAPNELVDCDDAADVRVLAELMADDGDTSAIEERLCKTRR